MNNWSKLLCNSLQVLIEMLEIGLDLPKNSLSDLTKNGPHLLAPTASDLKKYGSLDQVLAGEILYQNNNNYIYIYIFKKKIGFHYDLNFLTIHGKSRYPGLNIWARNTPLKIQVKIPENCLLVQAGKELEWVTGGEIKAGYHEVVVNESTFKSKQNHI